MVYIFISCGKQAETPTPTAQQPTTYTISITAGDGGSVSSTGGTYEEGTQLNITATPSAEYVFETVQPKIQSLSQ